MESKLSPRHGVCYIKDRTIDSINELFTSIKPNTLHRMGLRAPMNMKEVLCRSVLFINRSYLFETASVV
jgi:hypothetical protein